MAKAEIHFGLKPIPIISFFSDLKVGAIQIIFYILHSVKMCKAQIEELLI